MSYTTSDGKITGSAGRERGRTNMKQIHQRRVRHVRMADSEWAFIQTETQRPTRVPPEVRDRFTPVVDDDGWERPS